MNVETSLAPPPESPGPTTSDDPAGRVAEPARRRDRIVGGIGSLLAERLGLDPLWVRLGFVILALIGGVGLLMYGGAWLLLVAAPQSGRRSAAIAGGFTLLVITPWMIAFGPSHLVTGSVAVVGLLAGIALSLWRPPDNAATEPVPPVPVPGGRPYGSTAEATAVRSSGEEAWPRSRRTGARHAHEPSMLGRATLGAALIVAAVGAIIDANNGGRMYPEQWLGAAAVVCGIGLLIGTVVGRARWLVVPAALAVAGGAGAGSMARLGIPLDQAIGDRYLTVSADSHRTDYLVRRGLGSANVWVDKELDRDVAVTIRLVAGSLDVTIPDGVRLVLVSDLGHGDIRVDGTSQPDGTVSLGPEDAPTVRVDAAIDYGDVNVYSYAPPVTEPIVINGAPPVAIDPRTPAFQISDQITMTEAGDVVLLGGQAVIDRDDQVIAAAFGSYFQPTPGDSSSGSTVISTDMGDFQLLPHSLLLDPLGQLYDLAALRARYATDIVPGTTNVVVPSTEEAGR